MLALISDLHSNVEALTAVFADIDRHPGCRIVCLGDVVGYGPEPTEVADMTRARVSACVRGNHDEALLTGGYGFHAAAKDAIGWTRAQLQPGFFSGYAVRQRWDWLATLPVKLAEGPDLFVHGSPNDPTCEYVLKNEVDSGLYEEKYRSMFQAFDRLLFVGHSHLPCVVSEDLVAREAAALGNEYVHRGGRAIVNVGSVGQPRDNDPRACYVLFDGEKVEWRRVPYDVEKAIAKFAQIPELSPRLAERLRLGR